ncbi:hypothetical protein [Microbulbifer sp.]|uniref:WD40/YVTN/BNR-like repeat-containing protein n=1 Tax=Microbulbifer sp. TaxID=1908541 RepID=UPI00258B46A3|nr:hypothetical protein [Microbulbifer sp.]
MSVVRFLLPALIATQSVAVAAADLLQTPALHNVRADHSVITSLISQDQGYLMTGERGLLLHWQSDSNWQQLDSPVSVGLTAATRLQDGSLIAVGQDAAILRRDADGQGWRKVFDGYDLTRLQITALKQHQQDLEQAIANAGEETDTDELKYQLEDTGFNLEDAVAELESGPSKPLLDIVSNEGRIIAVGAYGTLLYSDDNGKDWQLKSNLLDNPNRFHLNAVTRSANGSLIVVGESGTGFVSRDNGDSWTRLDLPYGGSLFGVTAQSNSSNLVAFGLQGNLIISRDNGQTWRHRHIDAGASLLGGTVTDAGDVYLVGHGGLVVRFPVDNPDAVTLRKHPSGAALSAVQVEGTQLILTGQFGATAWDIDENKD